MRYAILWYEVIKPKIIKRKKIITKLYSNISNHFKYSRIFYIVYESMKHLPLSSH